MYCDVAQQPMLVPVIGTRNWRLCNERLRGGIGNVRWDSCGGEYALTDGVSSGWVLRRIYPPMEPCSCLGGFLHDFGYRSGCLPRLELDDMFAAVCVACGMSDERATVAHDGLYVAGWAAWNKNRRNSIQTHRYRELGRIWVVSDTEVAA